MRILDKLVAMKLKNIRRKQSWGDCQDRQIHCRKTYLVKIYGQWFAGQFSRERYGLSFINWGCGGIQLDSIDLIYELCQ